MKNLVQFLIMLAVLLIAVPDLDGQIRGRLSKKEAVKKNLNNLWPMEPRPARGGQYGRVPGYGGTFNTLSIPAPGNASNLAQPPVRSTSGSTTSRSATSNQSTNGSNYDRFKMPSSRFNSPSARNINIGSGSSTGPALPAKAPIYTAPAPPSGQGAQAKSQYSNAGLYGKLTKIPKPLPKRPTDQYAPPPPQRPQAKSQYSNAGLYGKLTKIPKPLPKGPKVYDNVPLELQTHGRSQSSSLIPAGQRSATNSSIGTKSHSKISNQYDFPPREMRGESRILRQPSKGTLSIKPQYDAVPPRLSGNSTYGQSSSSSISTGQRSATNSSTGTIFHSKSSIQYYGLPSTKNIFKPSGPYDVVPRANSTAAPLSRVPSKSSSNSKKGGQDSKGF